MRKTLLVLGLVTLFAFAAGLGAIGTLAATDDDDGATMHRAMNGDAAMPMGGMPMMSMNGMSMSAMAGMAAMPGMGAGDDGSMPMDAEAMEEMHASMPTDVESMDAMHSAMSAQMPADVRAACDQAHARMTDS